MGSYKIYLSVALGAAALAGLVVMGIFLHFVNQPAGDHPQEIIINIQPGMSLTKVSQLLARKGLIGNPTTFRLYTYLKGEEGQIQAGEYALSPTLLPAEILDKLTSGQTLVHAVTIPEGFRIQEIADLLAAKGLVQKELFITETKRPDHIKALHIPTKNLEGYLFPDTYRVPKQIGEAQMVQRMVEIFKSKVLNEANLKRARELGMSFHEIITLASLIEKETGRPEERKLISAVFHNRLKKKMRLQTDPTVIFALANFDGNIRKVDLSIDSPYNTYRHHGLPPGPIASPGLAAIDAALHPADSKALYFVSRKDGSHQFSNNLQDHNRAVAKYQLRPARGNVSPRPLQGKKG
ncbi:MAG: endolytic transglycosylase MltG [Nitrospinaceae bacterium]